MNNHQRLPWLEVAGPTHYDDSLSFLLSQVGARSAQLFAERLAPLGISPRAFGVLSNLALAEGQSQQQLADALGMHRNNMVSLVDELEAAGWVKRHRSTDDRRVFELRLTARGRSVVSRVNSLIPGLDAELAAGLRDGERKQLGLLLRRAADGLALTPGVHPHLASRPHRRDAGT
jgi:DNA-binding MarR family transcriptional regulator